MSAITKTDDGLVIPASVERRTEVKVGDETTHAMPGGMMDSELKQYLEAMEARMFARFATKEDLAGFATKEDLGRVETRLLTEFHKWASPADMRARSHALAIRATDLDVEALRERVERLEGKKAS
jgi:hypothetical protein